MDTRLTEEELKLLYSEKVHLIPGAFSVYADSRQGDPHQAFATLLDVSRDIAKSLLYMFLYKDDSWICEYFRREASKEREYLQMLDLPSSTARREAADWADTYARSIERTRRERNDIRGV